MTSEKSNGNSERRSSEKKRASLKVAALASAQGPVKISVQK